VPKVNDVAQEFQNPYAQGSLSRRGLPVVIVMLIVEVRSNKGHIVKSLAPASVNMVPLVQKRILKDLVEVCDNI